jgi:hypothetical protein
MLGLDRLRAGRGHDSTSGGAGRNIVDRAAEVASDESVPTWRFGLGVSAVTLEACGTASFLGRAVSFAR